jgi:hypothetical protein
MGRPPLFSAILIALVGSQWTCASPPNHCGDRNSQKGLWAEFDYNHGDRCILELPIDGKILVSPKDLTLRPALSDEPTAASMVITAFSEYIEDTPECRAAEASDFVTPACRTVADGYQLTIEMTGECTGLSLLDHDNGTTTCFITEPTLLRCLTDAAGSLVINVSSTRETPSADDSQCTINVSSGAVEPVEVKVVVKNSLDDLNLAIHSPLEAAGTCGASPASACAVGGAPRCDGELVDTPPLRSIPFYVATEREDQTSPPPDDIAVVLAHGAVVGPPAAGFFSDSECTKPPMAVIVPTDSSKSDVEHLCISNLAGTYQILAVAQSSGLGASFFVSAETVPWRVVLTEVPDEGTTTDGDTTGGDMTYYYEIEVLDALHDGIPDLEVHVVSAEATDTLYSVTTDGAGRAFIDATTELAFPTVRFPTWNNASCEPVESK